MSDAILRAWTELPKAAPDRHVPPHLSPAATALPSGSFRATLAIGLLATLVVLVLALATMRLASPVTTAVPAKVVVVAPSSWVEIVKPV